MFGVRQQQKILMTSPQLDSWNLDGSCGEHGNQKTKTDWLTEQQIARYFSRPTALNKSGRLQRTHVVSLNGDEETEDGDLAAELRPYGQGTR